MPFTNRFISVMWSIWWSWIFNRNI